MTCCCFAFLISSLFCSVFLVPFDKIVCLLIGLWHHCCFPSKSVSWVILSTQKAAEKEKQQEGWIGKRSSRMTKLRLSFLETNNICSLNWQVNCISFSPGVTERVSQNWPESVQEARWRSSSRDEENESLVVFLSRMCDLRRMNSSQWQTKTFLVLSLSLSCSMNGRRCHLIHYSSSRFLIQESVCILFLFVQQQGCRVWPFRPLNQRYTRNTMLAKLALYFVLVSSSC